MANTAEQMESMLPSTDTDYYNTPDKNFTAAEFASDSFKEAKEKFMDAGKIDVNPDDPAVFTAYKRVVDYLKDTGLAGLGLADTAFKYAVGSVAQAMPTEQLEKRLARDLYSIPEAFAGAAGAKSLTQLDDAADAFVAGSKKVIDDYLTPDPNTLFMAGFTGTNPPTYEPRIDLNKYFKEFNIKPGTRKAEVIKEALSDPEISARFKPKLTTDEIFFRKPIMQFIRSLDVPKKGILGSNFSKLIKENPSISPTSLQEQLITPTKRYSKEELEDIFKSGEFSTAAMPKISSRTFETYQRQKQVGFRGGKEKKYFEIPIKSFVPEANIEFKSKAFRKLQEEQKKGKPELVKFRPKRDTHFGDNTIGHLRGSIIQPKATTFSLPEFDKIIKSRPFLLVEELQSNLVQGGFLKSNFDDIYDEAIYRFNDASLNSYDRVFRITRGNSDRKLRDLIQKIDKENPVLPDSFIYKHNLEYGVKGEKLIDKDGEIVSRKEALSPFEFEDYLRDKLKSEGLEGIPRRNFEDFFAKYRQSISGRTYYQKTGKERQALQEYGSPPITKNKQAVEELIKVAIGKAANEGVNYIVFPNVARIKMARNEEFDPSDKSDMFYKIYFKELNKALMDLEKNYPVEIYNVNLPYDDKAFLSSMGALSPDVPDLYLDTFRKFVESNSPKLTNEVIPSNGTILDVTDLVKKFKVEEPRQFAEGGDTVRPEPRPETRPFPDVKPQAKPDSDEYRGRTYDIYSVDLDGIETNVIEFKDGKKISAPQIRQMFEEYKSASEPIPGKQTSQEISKFLEDNNPTYDEFIRHFTAKRINKGGLIGDQMQMAFMSEGGLTDDGMNTDPVSGNEVPSGSMAEEVRDDIPAQLSEGEYVVPADVVRYYGVKFFEDLRDQAKMGLAQMEANGRIGGEPVPDGGPMNTQELSPEEMQAIQEIMGMSNGGSVESDMLGGKTSAQVEQDILDQGSAAKTQNYTGIPLGSTIFDPVNTNTGVQQTEAKAFTPIVLYNTAGQTRTVNSAEERKSAEAAGFTMTLEQYNMYRSQRGGSGGSGGGSGIITPPGQEDKESKPWGEGTDWNNEDSIREFVKNAQEGNIQGASGRFLRGAGFALFGLPGALLAGAFQTFQAKQTLADMQTAKEIARANGFPKLEKEIEGNINTYLKTAGDAVNFINDVFGPGTSQSDRFAKTQGFDTFEDYEAAQEDIRSKAAITKKKTPSFKGLKSTYTKKTDKPYVKVDKDGKTISKTSSTKPGATPSVTPKGDLDVAKEQEKYEGGPGFRNKGGLMTKGKKKK